MRFKGRFKSILRDWETGRFNLTFELIQGHINELDELKDKTLSVDVTKFYNQRTGRHNRLLWGCINQIVIAHNDEVMDDENFKNEDLVDKWAIYLHYIKERGQFISVSVYPDQVDMLKKQWREVEVVGPTIENGEEKLEVLCYFGSSTYNTKEFAALLNSIIADMKAMNLPTPTSEEMRVALEEVEANGKK